MKEHVLVFDHPPKFGKGVPESYDLKVFDVPTEKKGRIIGLLKDLGFEGIKDECADRHICMYMGDRSSSRELCIQAEYHAGANQAEYHKFWEKKESIELEIDKLQIAH